MANPIYILQLTDWHLFDEKVVENKPKDEQAKELKKFKKLEPKKNHLIQNVQLFLKEKGRAYLDVICVTGDMMDKNGDDNKGEFLTDYSIAAKMVNDVAANLLDEGDKRRLYSTPGNHDLSTKTAKGIIENDFCTKVVLKKPGIPNYLIVDSLHENLKTCYSKYLDFLEEINATNKDNPFTGFDEIKFKYSSLFISWFNSSWLSLGNYNYKKIKSDYDCKYIYEADYQNLSLGSSINMPVHKAFEDFKKANKDIPKFSFSMSHHFPRLLNWFDKYDVENEIDILDNIKNENSELKEITKEYLKKAKHKTNVVESMYSQFKKYDLVLNGHTHGKLFDKPFLTSEGLNTHESFFLKKDFFIYEIDVIRKYIIVYHIPFQLIKPEDSYEFNVYKIITFDDVEYAKKMKSNYSKQDLFDDLLYNDKLNFGDDKNMSINNLISSININKMTKNQLITTIDNFKLDKSVLKDDPLILKRIKGEILGLKTKLS